MCWYNYFYIILKLVIILVRPVLANFKMDAHHVLQVEFFWIKHNNIHNVYVNQFHKLTMVRV